MGFKGIEIPVGVQQLQAIDDAARRDDSVDGLANGDAFARRARKFSAAATATAGPPRVTKVRVPSSSRT